MRLLTCLLSALIPIYTLADKPVQQYLTEGSAFLANREFSEALMSFDAAIRQDPSHYVSYFQRATVYLSLGRTNAAAEDFTKILELKPDFEQALLRRARIYAQDGQFEQAQADLEKYLKVRSSDEEASTLRNTLAQAATHAQQAEADLAAGQSETCIEHISSVIQTAPRSARFLRILAECHVAHGDIEEAVGDYTRVAHLTPSDPAILLQLASINFFSLYEPQGALSHVKQCLHYDPEQKQCKALFRQIKRLDKQLNKILVDYENNRFATVGKQLIGTASTAGLVSEIDAPLATLEEELNAKGKLPKRLHIKCYELACAVYGKQKDKAKIEKWCSATLAIQDDNVDALLYRGEAKLDANDFEEAVRDLEKANQASGGENGRVRQLLQRAQQLLRQSKRRDYYKILGVARDADTRDIKRAYRQQAQEWHPDKYSGELSKDEVEKKMAEINQAYEVLNDAEKREQFDNGFDPYDPEANQHGGGDNPFGGNPFAHHFQGGFPFGGDGQSFHFKMNF